MIGALTKSISGITKVDLDELVQRAWPESENVEYKAELHREKRDQPDPWYEGKNVSDGAKKAIFKAVVAFANTSGGRLFVGIEESSERPPGARGIRLVPRCAVLAERIEQAVISSIDPPLTFFRVIGVPLDSEIGRASCRERV